MLLDKHPVNPEEILVILSQCRIVFDLILKAETSGKLQQPAGRKMFAGVGIERSPEGGLTVQLPNIY